MQLSKRNSLYLIFFSPPKCHNPRGLSWGSVVRCRHSGPCGAAEEVEKREDAERDAGGEGRRGPRGLGPVFGARCGPSQLKATFAKYWDEKNELLFWSELFDGFQMHSTTLTKHQNHTFIVLFSKHLKMRMRLRQFCTSVWIRDLDAGAQGRVKRPKPVTVMTEGALRESTGGREGGTDMVRPTGTRTPPIPNRPLALSLQQWFLPSVTRSLIPPIVYMVEKRIWSHPLTRTPTDLRL